MRVFGGDSHLGEISARKNPYNPELAALETWVP
jgi:hypothetical protein